MTDRLRTWLHKARVRLFPVALRRVLRPASTGVQLVRLGSVYGGWVVPQAILERPSVCYLFGLGTDASLELALAEAGMAEVHSFDPTPEAIAFASAHLGSVERVSFHPVGVWASDGPQRFFAPKNPAHVSHSILNLQSTDRYFVAECRRLPTLMKELGHDRLDLVKLDVEGAEIAVIEDLLVSDVRPRALCVEFDQPAPLRPMLRTIRQLTEAGYRLVAIDRWNYTFVRSG